MAGGAGEPTVYVVDDDDAALDSLLMLLRAEGLTVRGFPLARDFLEFISPDHRGCLITDLRMPEMDGVELIRALRARGSALPAIVITGHADVSKAVDAMKAGASDFIEKPFEGDVILRLVRTSLEAGEEAADAQAMRARIKQRLEGLTARERQVLDLVVDGASNKTVAQRLGISPRTVEIYRASVMSKMRAESLSELVRMTLAAGGRESRSA